MAGKKTKTVAFTTKEGIFSFPRVFASQKQQRESDGADQWDIQFLIPKTDVEGCRQIMKAIKEVGIGAFGDPGWKAQKNPLRDGDKEGPKMTADGTSTNAEKYPERTGHYFFNARTTKPVGVYNRTKDLITNESELYGGCRGRLSVTAYAYNNKSAGVGLSLNGVQKMGEGEPFGSVRPDVDTMFDLLDEADDTDLADDDLDPDPEPETTPPPAKKVAARKTAAKKAAAAKPEPVEVTDEDEDLMPDGDDSGPDEYDDL